MRSPSKGSPHSPAPHAKLRNTLDNINDARFQAVFETIRQMLATPVADKKAIGFHARLEARTRPTKPSNLKRK